MVHRFLKYTRLVCSFLNFWSRILWERWFFFFFVQITFHEGHICAAVADQCSTWGHLRSSGGLWLAFLLILQADLSNVIFTFIVPVICHFVITFWTEEMKSWKTCLALLCGRQRECWATAWRNKWLQTDGESSEETGHLKSFEICSSWPFLMMTVNKLLPKHATRTKVWKLCWSYPQGAALCFSLFPKPK